MKSDGDTEEYKERKSRVSKVYHDTGKAQGKQSCEPARQRVKKISKLKTQNKNFNKSGLSGQSQGRVSFRCLKESRDGKQVSYKRNISPIVIEMVKIPFACQKTKEESDLSFTFNKLITTFQERGTIAPKRRSKKLSFFESSSEEHSNFSSFFQKTLQ